MSARAASPIGKDLLGLEHLTAAQIRLILDTAEPFKEISERAIKKVPALRGQTIVNLFFEASTRTRISFEFAEKRLSADTVNVAASGSSVSKGETLVDTARNLEAMRIDMVVIRHSASGAAKFLADRIESECDQRRRRHARASHAGTARSAHAAGPRSRASRGCACASAATCCTRASRVRTSGDSRSSAPTWRCAGRRSLLPSAIGEFGVHGVPAHRGSDRVVAGAQRPAPAAGAHDSRLHPLAARVQPRVRRHA